MTTIDTRRPKPLGMIHSSLALCYADGMADTKPNIDREAWLGGLALAVCVAFLAWGWFAQDEKVAPPAHGQGHALELPDELPAAEHGGVPVQEYRQADGTRVRAHYRSSPDSSTRNNWGTVGNQNPYTGEWGTKQREPEGEGR